MNNFNKEKVLKIYQEIMQLVIIDIALPARTTLRNIQPFFADTNTGGIGVS